MKGLKPLKGSAAKRAALIAAGKLMVLDREATLAALRKVCGKEGLGDLQAMVDDGVIQAGLYKGETVMWLNLEPDQIRIEP
jgi:hypothetical protein